MIGKLLKMFALKRLIDMIRSRRRTR